MTSIFFNIHLSVRDSRNASFFSNVQTYKKWKYNGFSLFFFRVYSSVIELFTGDINSGKFEVPRK